MKKTSPFPITHENFSFCWKYVDKLRRKARLRARLCKTAGHISSYVFLACLLMGIHILIPTHAPQFLSGHYSRFLKGLSFFPVWEKQLFAVLFRPDASLLSNGLRLLIASYAVSVLAYLAAAMLICVLYHPLQKKLPGNQTQEEQVDSLISMAKSAYLSASATAPRVSMTSVILLYLAVSILLLLFGASLKNAELFQSLLLTSWSRDPGLNCILYGMAWCIGFVPLDYLRSVITCLFTRIRLPYSLIVEAQRYWVSLRTASREVSGTAVQLREQALELERLRAVPEAKAILLEAALLGDAEAMAHYARHCILDHDPASARYWLEESIAGGNASPETRKMLQKVKQRRRPDVTYLKESE